MKFLIVSLGPPRKIISLGSLTIAFKIMAIRRCASVRLCTSKFTLQWLQRSDQCSKGSSSSTSAVSSSVSARSSAESILRTPAMARVSSMYCTWQYNAKQNPYLHWVLAMFRVLVRQGKLSQYYYHYKNNLVKHLLHLHLI